MRVNSFRSKIQYEFLYEDGMNCVVKEITMEQYVIC